MKKFIYALWAVSALGVTVSQAQSDATARIAVVDLAKLYDTHYKTVEQNAKLRADEQKAEEEFARMNKEGNAMVEKYKEVAGQVNNPAATAEAKAQAQAEAQRMAGDIQRKQTEVQSYQQNIRNSLQQRIKSFRDLMIEEISKIAVDVAKRHGATLLLDKSGPTLIGVSNVIYFDTSYDITDDVLKMINKDRPASAPATAASDPADSSKIVLPGTSR